MDPNNLDPKLKETYDKVMGTQTTPQVSPLQPNSNNLNPVAAATVQNPAPITPPQASPQDNSSSTPSYTQDNLNFQASIQQPPAVSAPAVAGPVIIAPQQHTPPVLKILYVIGAIVFFIAYTFLWIKIFNLPLPF